MSFVKEYKIRKQKIILSNILTAKRILNVIAVNSAEVERGFSTMNNIDVKRNRLLMDTTSHLMIINLMKKSLGDAMQHILIPD